MSQRVAVRRNIQLSDVNSRMFAGFSESEVGEPTVSD